MSRQIIHTDNAPKAVGTYSQAVKVGQTVYISGQIGLNPTTMQLADGFEDQANQVLSNIEAICQAAGGSLSDVVKYNVSLVDLANFNALNEIFTARLPQPYPARAAVQVAKLPKDALVEIEAIVFLESVS
ncbi:endoribonuclease L-PSP [Moraxella macacae 0408225]|uniref:Endoribonuclease L-PSP n=1 Tax=Moraxella macacae 0408225 TaxID=1230338 RepID=L2F4U4_9GAMM|nr:Rid family detoxifying hydrolase [Moraxella macacae]ELA08032.1 endoribonuclease L-PSP [Moraxella macacae 0408225]